MNTWASGKVFNPPPEKRKKEIPKFFKIFLLILVVAGAVIYLFFYSTVFHVQNIITDEPILNDSLANLKGQNILLLSSSRIKSDLLAKFPEFEDIKIIRGFPDTIKIQTKLNPPKMIWRTQGRLYLVNLKGAISKEVEGLPDFPIVQDNKDLAVSIGQQVASESFINFINDLNSKFAPKVGFNLVQFEINETIFQVDALTDQGWLVKFDTTRSVDDQLEALTKLLAEHKDEIHEYADVRVEGKVYWK